MRFSNVHGYSSIVQKLSPRDRDIYDASVKAALNKLAQRRVTNISVTNDDTNSQSPDA